MLMCMAAAWCLPVKAAVVESNGYRIEGFSEDTYLSYNWEQSDKFCSIYVPEGAPENVYLSFKLDDPSWGSDFRLSIMDKGESDSKGELLVPFSLDGDHYSFHYSIFQTVGKEMIGRKYSYTVSLYGTQDTTASEPLASFAGSYEIKMPVQVSVSPNNMRGELNKAIPFTVRITANQFAGQKAMLNFVKLDGMAITCDELTDQNKSDKWAFAINSLQDAIYHFTLTCTTETRQGFEARLENEEGNLLLVEGNNWISVSIPFAISDGDIAGLQKIADDNNSDFLKEYITNKGYMSPENDSIQIDLDENISPARINNLHLMMHSLRTLDVLAFDSLEYLTINRAAITSLDLSTLKRLKSVGLYNTGITNLNDVKLPDNPELEVRGNINLPVGEQVSEYEYQLISGTQVDL